MDSFSIPLWMMPFNTDAVRKPFGYLCVTITQLLRLYLSHKLWINKFKGAKVFLSQGFLLARWIGNKAPYHISFLFMFPVSFSTGYCVIKAKMSKKKKSLKLVSASDNSCRNNSNWIYEILSIGVATLTHLPLNISRYLTQTPCEKQGWLQPHRQTWDSPRTHSGQSQSCFFTP